MKKINLIMVQGRKFNYISRLAKQMRKLPSFQQIASPSGGSSATSRKKQPRARGDQHHLGPQFLAYGQLDGTPRNARNHGRLFENQSESQSKLLQDSRLQLVDSPAADMTEHWQGNYRTVSNLAKSSSHGRHGNQPLKLYQTQMVSGSRSGLQPSQQELARSPHVDHYLDDQKQQNRTFDPDVSQQMMHQGHSMPGHRDNSAPFFNSQTPISDGAANVLGDNGESLGAPMQAAYYPHNMKKQTTAGYSFSLSSSRDDEEQHRQLFARSRKQLDVQQSEGHATEQSNYLFIKEGDDQEQVHPHQVVEVDDGEPSLRMKSNGQLNEPSRACPVNGPWASQAAGCKADNQEMESLPVPGLLGQQYQLPDEFHHQQQYFQAALQDSNGSNHEQIDFDGYNDYGVPNNFASTEKKLTKATDRRKVGDNGVRSSGAGRVDPQRGQMQQPAWPMIAETRAPDKVYNSTQKQRPDALDFEQHTSPASQQRPPASQPNRGVARQRKSNKRNTMVPGSSRADFVKTMPRSQKSPTGKKSRKHVEERTTYAELVTQRKQANTVLGREIESKRGTPWIQENSSESLTKFNSNLRAAAMTSLAQEDDDDIVAKLRSKCTTMSNSNFGTTVLPSPIPVTEPPKKIMENKRRTMGTIKGRVSPLRANSKLDISQNIEKKHHYFQQEKPAYYTNNPVTKKGSPMARTSPPTHSPPSYVDQSRRPSHTNNESKQLHSMPLHKKSDEDLKKKQKISPYKLIMFGEKDMYYKNGKKNYKDINVRGARSKRNSRDADMLVAQDNNENQIAESARTLYRTSEANNTHTDDFASLEQQDFHVGDGLVEGHNGSRSGLIYSTRFQKSDDGPRSDEDMIECQLIQQPKNLFDTESNARTDSKDGSVFRSRQVNAEMPLSPTLEIQRGLSHFNEEQNIILDACENQNDYVNHYVKYRPKTDRFYQSTDSKFPMISEQGEKHDGRFRRPSEDAGSEPNHLSKPQSNSNLRLDGIIQCTPKSQMKEDRTQCQAEVKNYVDNFIENGAEVAAGHRVHYTQSPMILQQHYEPDPRHDKLREQSGTPIIVNEEYDQMLAAQNHRQMNSGQVTMQSSIKHPSFTQSKTNSVLQSQPVSRKASQGDMPVASQQPQPVFPFESPKEIHKIVFPHQIKMGFLEPSCIEECGESNEHTNMNSAEPEHISELDRSPVLVGRPRNSDDQSTSGYRSGKFARDGHGTDIRESLCSIPEEYPSQIEEGGPNDDRQIYGQKVQLKKVEVPPKTDRKVPALDHPSIFITDKVINNYTDDAYGKCQEEGDNQYNPKYPTPDDREPAQQAQGATAQPSLSDVNKTAQDGQANLNFKADSDKQQLQPLTENKDLKQPQPCQQPRKLQKQTSLKSFHTFDPDGSKKRLQNITKSGESNIANLNLNEIMHNKGKDHQQTLNGTMDDIAAENSNEPHQTQEEFRAMTQEEYYQMKKEQLEDIYLGTEIIYEEDMENHEFSTLQTCQSAQRLILPAQFNNMNFEGNTTQSLSPKKRSSKPIVSPESRKSWQITNPLEQHASGKNPHQKKEGAADKGGSGNLTTVSRINNLRKKYSIDAAIQQKGATESSKISPLPSYLKLPQPPINSSTPIVAFNETSKQYVIHNQAGPFVPSTNLKPKLPAPNQQSDPLPKPSKIVKPSPTVCEANSKMIKQNAPTQLNLKQKQRSVSPLNVIAPSSQLNHSYNQSTNSQCYQPKSARNTAKTFQNQFKPRARNDSVSKSKTSKSPHQRPYTSQGVTKHGQTARPSIPQEKSPSTSPAQSKKNIASTSNKQLKQAEEPGNKNETLVDQAYHKTSSQSQLQGESTPMTKQKKQQTQHETYHATLDTFNQRAKGQIESHKLSWKKFMQHKKSQQHTQSHILLNSSSSKIENSQLSQNQSSVNNVNQGDIKVGQLNLINSDRGSVKSFDKLNENRRGRSEGKYSQSNDQQQVKSMYNRLESEAHDDTFIGGSGLSVADNRLDDASQSKEGNLPRMASYTTHHQGSQKPSAPPSTTELFNSPPKDNTPIVNEPMPSVELTSSTKKPLVPKLKLSKVQLHRGVPKPLLTPQGVAQSKVVQTFSLKTVTQKQTTARNNLPPSVAGTGADASEQKKKLMVQQQLSLPHVQASKKNMMKAAARERKWVQGNMLKKSDKKKKLGDGQGVPGNAVAPGSAIKPKQSAKRQVVIDLQPDAQDGAPEFGKRLSIPILQSQKIEFPADHNPAPTNITSIQALASSPPQAPPESDDVFHFAQEQSPLASTEDLVQHPGHDLPSPIINIASPVAIRRPEHTDRSVRPSLQTRGPEKDDECEEERALDNYANLFERTHDNKSSLDRKISTADEFKKNHILKMSPAQEAQLAAQNMAELGDLHYGTDVIILSTNSEQRVLSKTSYKSPERNSLSDRSTPNVNNQQIGLENKSYELDNNMIDGYRYQVEEEEDCGMLRCSREQSEGSGRCFNNGLISIQEQCKERSRAPAGRADHKSRPSEEQVPSGRTSSSRLQFGGDDGRPPVIDSLEALAHGTGIRARTGHDRSRDQS